MNLMVIGECCIEWVYSDLVCSKWEDRGTRTIRCKTIRCGQFVMDNSLHGQFVAKQFVADNSLWTIRCMDNSLQDDPLQDNLLQGQFVTWTIRCRTICRKTIRRTFIKLRCYI
jgi:hypothetical protein